MVDHLELQSAVEPVEPLGTAHIHGGTDRLGGEVLFALHIGGVHAVVRDVDLEVEN